MKKLIVGTALLMLFTLGTLFAQEPPQNVVATGNTTSLTITWDAPQGNPTGVGYRVYRLIPGQEENQSLWICLTASVISGRTLVDIGWFQLPNLTYKWAVIAIYVGGASSQPAFSNSITVPLQVGTLTGIVRSSSGIPISNATIHCSSFTTTTSASGLYTLYANPGVHTVTASHPEYLPATIQNVIIVDQEITTLNIVLQVSSSTLTDSFEAYEDFSLSFSPWVTADVDMSETNGLDGYDWQNEGAPQAFIVFNPSATTPPLPNVLPHSGDKMLACFSAVTPPNWDWLITPIVSNPLEIRFFARSLSAVNGLERFRVGVSHGQVYPAYFILLSQEWVTVPETWTQFTFDLSSYYGQEVRIGIECGSNECTALLVDDVIIEPNGAADDPGSPALGSCITGNYPNPFASRTTISYRLRISADVTMDIYDLRGRKVRSLMQKETPGGEHELDWDGRDDAGTPVSGGIYLCRLRAGKEISTRKLLIVH